MDTKTVHPTFQEALGTFEALRRLGFDSADIFFHLNPSGEMLVVLQTQEKQFSVTVGMVAMEHAEWKEAWSQVASAVSGGEVDQDALDSWWQKSRPHRQGLAFLTAILSKGIAVPNAEPISGMLN